MQYVSSFFIMSRKRQSLSFELKKSICEQIERNCKTQAELARDYGLSRTTINTIWSQREKYKTNSCNDKAKRMRKGNYMYEDIEEALMTWLVQDLDNHFGKKKRRILLIIDNSSSHDPTLSTSLKNIGLKFLPPNCTSHIQPCDLGIIKNLSFFYRRRDVFHGDC